MGVMCPHPLPCIRYFIYPFSVFLYFGLVVTSIPKRSMLHNTMRRRGLNSRGLCIFIKNDIEREKSLIQNARQRNKQKK
jgi:hypothetical protein